MANWMVGESAFVKAAQNSRLYLMVLDSVYTSRAAPSFSDIFTVSIWGCRPRAVLLSTCLQSNNRVELAFKEVLGSEIKPLFISKCVNELHLRYPVK